MALHVDNSKQEVNYTFHFFLLSSTFEKQKDSSRLIMHNTASNVIGKMMLVGHDE